MKKFGNGFGPNLDEYRRALERLGFENRNFLDEIVDWLGSFGSPQATTALNSWSDPERLEHLDNPMRCRLATSLGKRGDNQTLKILEPWVVSGNYLNHLTSVAVNAVAEIAERHSKSTPAAIAILKRGYPPLPKDGNQFERDFENCLRLAATVHQHLQALTEKKVEFPDSYDETTRKKLMASW